MDIEISKPSEYFEKVLPGMVEEDPKLLDGVEVVAQWNVAGPEPEVWTTIVQGGVLSCTPEPAEDPEITVNMSSDVLLAIYRKELKAIPAYMTGKFKMSGDITKAMKLAKLLQ